MDGIQKLTSSGFPRNDSEALFQDFIRRIPSQNNLTTSESLNYLDPAQQAQLQQSVQQMQQQAQQQTQNNGVLRSISSSDLQEVGGLEVKNFPRVASLDYLQHLVQQSAAASQQNAKQSPAPAPGEPQCSARQAGLLRLAASPSLQLSAFVMSFVLVQTGLQHLQTPSGASQLRRGMLRPPQCSWLLCPWSPQYRQSGLSHRPRCPPTVTRLLLPCSLAS